MLLYISKLVPSARLQRPYSVETCYYIYSIKITVTCKPTITLAFTPIVTLSVTNCSASNQEMTSQSSNGGGKECTLSETITIRRNYCKNVSACSNRREVLLLALDHSFPGTEIRWDSLVWQADTNSLGNRIERNKIDLPVTMVVHTYSSINITCTMYCLVTEQAMHDDDKHVTLPTS